MSTSIVVQMFFTVALLGFRIYLYVISRQDTYASVDTLLKFTNRFLLVTSITTFIGLMLSVIVFISMQLNSDMTTIYTDIARVAGVYVFYPLGAFVTVYFIAGIYKTGGINQ